MNNHGTKKNHGLKKVVIIGGGTGQSRMLQALKDDIDNLSAVVVMADDGGSTGRLRKYQNAPAVGDLRNCLTALGDSQNTWTKIFPYRFGNARFVDEPKDIEGHTVGNIILVAFIDMLGGLRPAIAAVSKELGIRPTHGVYPSTFENVILKVKLNNGDILVGQYNMAYNVPRAKKFRINKLWLDREPFVEVPIKANPDAVNKILAADVILIGPGALHGSILANLVIPDIKQAVLKSKAKKIYIANTAIKLAETRGFTLEDHVASLIAHTAKNFVDLILVNNKIIAHDKPIVQLKTSKKTIAGIPVVQADLIDEKDVFVHDPKKLRHVLVDFIAKID